MLEALTWFQATHQLRPGFSVALWQRVSLPGPGGLGDQDARTMEAISLICAEENLIQIEQVSRRRGGRTPRRAKRG